MLLNEQANNNTNKNKIISRAITVKTRPDTDTLNPSGFSNNLNSVLRNSSPKKNFFKKTETVKNKDNDQQNNGNITTNRKTNDKLSPEKNKLDSNGRIDRFGNKICKNGKQRVSFIDKISKNKINTVINVESYKKFNKMEEVSFNNQQNVCCFLI